MTRPHRAGPSADQPAPSVAAGTASVAICNWRDLTHPEGGGSELYVETVAQRLAARGNSVTILCSRVSGRPADEVRGGVRYLRSGGKRTVYLRAAWSLLTAKVRPDVVLDVQNGLPFLSPLVTRRPVTVLLHHVHREQWPIVFGRLGGAVGWWLESNLGPHLYRGSRYVTVSECTRQELAEQGITPPRVSVAHNGTPAVLSAGLGRSATPRVVVLGRLVPHKRVEICIRAAAVLRTRLPELRLDVIGQGWWADPLHKLARELAVDDIVTFHGFVDDQRKADLLHQAWVNAVPSIKEGWGLSVVEAASQGTPSIAFTDAGGLSESILGGRTGVLVHGDDAAFVRALAALLEDPHLCAALGEHAMSRAAEFDWEDAVATVAGVLDSSLGHLALTVPRGEDGTCLGQDSQTFDQLIPSRLTEGLCTTIYSTGETQC